MSQIILSPNASGTGNFTVAAPNSNSNQTLTLPDGTGTVVANNVNSAIVLGTSQNSTSGTNIDFTGIPSWVKRITVMFNGVSTNGTSNLQIQIGSTTFTTSGYNGYTWSSNTTSTSHSSGFLISAANSAAYVYYGNAYLTNISGNIWVFSTASGCVGNNGANTGGGTVSLSGTLDRVRFTTVNGTDTFDAGSINIMYE